MTVAFARSLEQLFSIQFVSVLVRSLLVVVGLFVVLGIALEWAIASFTFPLPGLEAFTAVLAFFSIIGSMWFLIVPITMIVAGIFLEEVAAAVEARYYPADPPGRDLPPLRALSVALQFTAVVVVLNIALLPTLFIGIGALAYFIANAYLVGREYFELVALRHMRLEDARVLRRGRRWLVWLSGAMFTALLLVPLVNLLVPLFATAFMVHIFKGLDAAPAPSGLTVATRGQR
jgi:CysZ protein